MYVVERWNGPCVLVFLDVHEPDGECGVHVFYGCYNCVQFGVMNMVSNMAIPMG